jgi:hypothetical protein
MSAVPAETAHLAKGVVGLGEVAVHAAPMSMFHHGIYLYRDISKFKIYRDIICSALESAG